MFSLINYHHLKYIHYIVLNNHTVFAHIILHLSKDFIENSLKIIKLHPDRRNEMRHMAVEQSKYFHMDSFLNKFRVMVCFIVCTMSSPTLLLNSYIYKLFVTSQVVRASQSRDFKKTIATYIPIMRSMPLAEFRMRSRKTAIIIEPDINSQFEFCVRNILRFLGK